MNFKEYIANDNINTYMNKDEFAEEKEINGKTVLLVEDSDKLEKRIKKDYDGLIVGDVLFYISENEYRKIPRVSRIPNAGMALNYAGKPATVINVGNEAGIYEIIISTAGGY